MLVGGVTEFPERPSPDYFESQMDHFKKVCEVFVISNRILDPLPRLDSDHPVRIWYERLQSHDAFGSARKFVNFPRIGALMLDDSWVEYTLRTNDHPALYVIQKRGA
jgi:hypothetical protein